MSIELHDLSPSFPHGNTSADGSKASKLTSKSTPSHFAKLNSQTHEDKPFGAPLAREDSEDLDFNHLAAIPLTESYKVHFQGCEVSIDPLDWRSSVLLKLQVCAGFCVFVLFGLADQTIGTVIPVLEKDYNIDDSQTGLIFLASTLGYFVMAIATESFHRNFGVRGVGILGAFSMALSYLIIFQKPPYYMVVFAYVFSGIGCGSLDASFNGWMGNLVDSNQLLGILHGCYGIGCMISPPLVTRLLEKKENPWMWNDYYLVLSSMAAFCLVYFSVAFRHETPAKYKFMMLINEARKLRQDKLDSDADSDKETDQDTEQDNGQDNLHENLHENLHDNHPSQDFFTNNAGLDNVKGPTITRDEQDAALGDSVPLSVALTSKLVWSFSIIMFLYVGAESAFGTWLITFLTRIKGLSFKQSSYMATTFWTGLTLGRIFLGFVTAHYFTNELNANWCYITLSLVGHALFSLVVLTSSYTKILFPIVLFSGLFVGPIFPTNIVCAIRILPAKFHASGVGFICAFGGGGAAAVPFLVGLVAEASDLGLRFYAVIVAVLYLVLFLLWTILRGKNLPKLRLPGV
ncbi:hypothetical protein JCM33374_g6194 [Metschnikowia sp. JCM 33374]|nr:hypothetical protein JCM33374_g6194 [Metschnikowia sp. JCM 33374]